MRGRVGTLAAVALLGVALLQPVAKAGCTQTSQLALTRAFAAGTARIDRWEATTCDKAWFGGHYYSVKAPGLAVAALPLFLVLRAAHVLPHDDATTIWLLGLVTVVPAALLLAGMTARAGDRVAPGTGALAAVTLGLATIAFPFGTLWFGHVPAAAAAFTAFVLLFEATPATRTVRFAAAGLIAGTGVLFEYPVALIAAALLLYALARHGGRAAGAFLGGSLLPAVLLVAYNTWAFGSPLHFSYQHAVIVTGNSGHDVVGANDAGFFGITWPSIGALAQLLVSPRGLLTLAPICLLGGMGIVLVRRRAPLESLLAGGLVIVFLAYNAGYTLSFGGPFGGDSPGPRFLIAVLPFLVFPVGAAIRALPGAGAALLAGSAAAMLLVTTTAPMVGVHETHTWLARLRDDDFTRTVWSLAGAGNSWITVVPIVLPCAVLGALALRDILTVSRDTGPLVFQAACALVSWLLLLYGSWLVYDHHRHELGIALLGLAGLTAATAFIGRQYVVSSTPA